jgi:class 3 adenylate cyclase/tetratricopeptide (TPR) repeat protein
MAADRRLLAIMFTDIKGYSAMVGADEQLTLRLVTEHRALVRDALARFGGTEHRTIGDAFLVLFESAVTAVNCAVDIQERLLARNGGLPPSEQVWLRIGVHLGEVVYDQERDVFGDAVNTAARVEPHAPPGGIAITDPVARLVRAQVRHPIERVGPVPMKNIANPPELYRIVIAPWTPPPAPRPWGRIALGVGGVVALGAVLVAVAWPRAEGLPTVSADPAVQAAFERSIAENARGDFVAAHEALDEARGVEPDNPLLTVADAVIPSRFDTGAMIQDAARRVSGRSDPEAELLRLLAWTERDGDERAEADAWDAWVAAHPGSSWGAYLRAYAYPLHGADDATVDTLGRVRQEYVDAHPDDVAGRFLLAEHVRQSDPEAAITLLEGWTARCPCPALRESLGDALMSEARYDEARAAYAGAVQRDPALAYSRMQLADIALEQGDESTRAELASYALSEAATPRERVLFEQQHAEGLFAHGRRREARELYARAVGETAGGQGLALDLAGKMIHEDLGLLEVDRAREELEAFEALSRAPEVAPERQTTAAAEALIFRGLIAAMSGDPATARALRDRATALPPDRWGTADRAWWLDNLDAWLLPAEGRIDEARALRGRMGACSWWLPPAGYVESLAGDVDAAIAAYASVEQVCPAGATTPRVVADVLAAELYLQRGDREHAREAATRARAIWSHADPDLVLVRRLVAVETALDAPDP